nr:hypothetical protein [Tanacetum cinerariifolium]
MLHGPCDKDAKYAPCNIEGKCSKCFPKAFNAETIIDAEGYPIYCRMDNKASAVKGKFKKDTEYLCLHFTRNHEELMSNMPYPEDFKRRIEDYLKILKAIERGPYSKEPPIRRIDLNQYGEMDNPDITMEEYIQLEAEQARRHAQEFNWETATYGKVMYFEDIDYFKDFETDFPAIVYKDALTSEPGLI